MNDWASGYVSEIDYTYGYYQELNPARVRLAFLHAGLVPPVIEEACELGFGQGVSLNIHAAGATARWHGTDFNPSQAAHAQSLAAASGANARVFDQSFAEFAERRDLPEFDYIGLHGIWSWISDENRRVIVDFVKRTLKPGGVLYISYNTNPGWGTMVPLRGLMTEHARVMAAPGQGIVGRINASIEFAEKVLSLSPAFTRANPTLIERLKKIKDQGRNYLAHEYFNRDWAPMTVGEMGEWLSGAKLNYACSAHYLDHVAGLNLTADQQALLKEIPDPLYRELVHDFLCNQQFRRDYWVKGARRLSAAEQLTEVMAQRVILTTPRADVTYKVTGSLGEASLQENIYVPVLDIVADHKIHTIGEIEKALRGKSIGIGQIVAAIMVLIGKGDMAPVQDDARLAAAKSQASKLNAALLARAARNREVNYLVSPLTGGAVGASRFQQLFMAALGNGAKTPDDWAKAAWGVLAAQNQQIIKDGKPLEGADANIAELTAQAKDFADKRLAILKALKVV